MQIIYYFYGLSNLYFITSIIFIKGFFIDYRNFLLLPDTQVHQACEGIL